MHDRYAKDGLVILTVSLDEKESAADALAFLQKQNPPFTNLRLDETPEVWQEKLRFDGPPAVFLFNRQGKWKQFKGEGFGAALEKQVVEWLKQK